MFLWRPLAITLCCLAIASPVIGYAIDSDLALQKRSPPKSQTQALQVVTKLVEGQDERVAHLKAGKENVYLGEADLNRYRAIGMKVKNDKVFIAIGRKQLWAAQVPVKKFPRQSSVNTESWGEKLDEIRSDILLPRGCDDSDEKVNYPLQGTWNTADEALVVLSLGGLMHNTGGLNPVNVNTPTAIEKTSERMASILGLGRKSGIEVISALPGQKEAQLLLERHSDGRTLLWRGGLPVMLIDFDNGSPRVRWNCKDIKYPPAYKPHAPNCLPEEPKEPDYSKKIWNPWFTVGFPGTAPV